MLLGKNDWKAKAGAVGEDLAPPDMAKVAWPATSFKCVPNNRNTVTIDNVRGLIITRAKVGAQCGYDDEKARNQI